MANARQVYLMVILVFATVVTLVAYGAWDSIRADDAAERQVAEAGERGAHLFATYCRVCHGRGGEGGIGPPLNQDFRTAQQMNFRPSDPLKLQDAQTFVTNTIRCGRAGTLMPSWHIDQGGALTDEQIRQLMILITENPEVPPSGLEATFTRPAEPAWERAKAEADHADETEWFIAQGRDISPSATTITVNGTGRLPFKEGDIFRLDDELLKIAKIDGNTIQVERGQRGTQPALHRDGEHLLLGPIDPPSTAPAPACGQVVKTPAPAAGGGAVQPSTSWQVSATDNKFDKTQLAVPAGQEFTITLKNDGQAPHNLHIFESQTGPSIAITDPQLITGGQSGTVKTKIDKAGSYFYKCDFHPTDMTGTLTVQ